MSSTGMFYHLNYFFFLFGLCLTEVCVKRNIISKLRFLYLVSIAVKEIKVQKALRAQGGSTLIFTN